jgi:hypothetical protein
MTLLPFFLHHTHRAEKMHRPDGARPLTVRRRLPPPVRGGYRENMELF